jgi:hypothetical protein
MKREWQRFIAYALFVSLTAGAADTALHGGGVGNSAAVAGLTLAGFAVIGAPLQLAWLRFLTHFARPS